MATDRLLFSCADDGISTASSESCRSDSMLLDLFSPVDPMAKFSKTLLLKRWVFVVHEIIQSKLSRRASVRVDRDRFLVWLNIVTANFPFVQG